MSPVAPVGDGAPLPEADSAGPGRAAFVFWTCCSLVLVLLLIARGGTVIPNLGALDHVSGAWTALAVDLAQGEFYRPLFDAKEGYGGTRFFPLHVVLHAALIRGGVDPFAAGHVLGIGSVLALLAGTFVLLRRLQTKPWLATLATSLVLAAPPAQHALLTIRGDGLPAALNVWALAAVAGERPRLGFAMVLFVLAFSAKVTTLFGAAAAVGWFLATGRRSLALRLGVGILVGMGLTVAVTQGLSHGRFLEILRTCASGGATWSDVLRGPSRLVLLAHEHGSAFLLLLLAVAALAVAPRRDWLQLPVLGWLATAIATVVIFGSPGTADNHLVDLYASSTVLLATRLTSGRPATVFVVVLLALATLAGVLRAVDRLRGPDLHDARADLLDAVRAAASPEAPVLSETPLLPLLQNRRPRVLDPFMLRLSARGDPEIARGFLGELTERRFGAVVLFSDPRTERGRTHLLTTHFGPGFVEVLDGNYLLVARCGPFLVYRPRAR